MISGFIILQDETSPIKNFMACWVGRDEDFRWFMILYLFMEIYIHMIWPSGVEKDGQNNHLYTCNFFLFLNAKREDLMNTQFTKSNELKKYIHLKNEVHDTKSEALLLLSPVVSNDCTEKVGLF